MDTPISIVTLPTRVDQILLTVFTFTHSLHPSSPTKPKPPTLGRSSSNRRPDARAHSLSLTLHLPPRHNATPIQNAVEGRAGDLALIRGLALAGEVGDVAADCADGGFEAGHLLHNFSGWGWEGFGALRGGIRRRMEWLGRRINTWRALLS